MTEQEILLALEAHVARHQSFGPEEQPPAQSRFEVSTIDLLNISRLSAEVWTAHGAVGKLNPRNPGLLNQLAQAFKKALQRSLSWYTRSLQVFHWNVARAIVAQGTAINSIQRSLARLEDEVLKVQSDTSAISRFHRASESEVLQESLRVAELATQEQQAPYVELFRGLSPVVDLGCGRGEFLELLKAKGIVAYGVDSDRTVCGVGHRKLLKVVDADLFDHLRHLSDRSLGGAFAARVIEYLPTHQQVELIALLSGKVKPGGLVVVETINPESTLGFGRNSHLDPTHVQAIHPELLKSILESHNFTDVRICTLAPVEELLMLLADARDFSHNTESRRRPLSGAGSRLTSAQAYAAVGRRS